MQPTLNPDSPSMIKDVVLLNRYAALAAAHGDRSGFKPGDVVAVKCASSPSSPRSPPLAVLTLSPAPTGPPSTQARSSSSASSRSRTASCARSRPTPSRPCASRTARAGSRATSGTTRATRTRLGPSRWAWSRAASTGSCGPRGASPSRSLSLFLSPSRKPHYEDLAHVRRVRAVGSGRSRSDQGGRSASSTPSRTSLRRRSVTLSPPSLCSLSMTKTDSLPLARSHVCNIYWHPSLLARATASPCSRPRSSPLARPRPRRTRPSSRPCSPSPRRRPGPTCSWRRRHSRTQRGRRRPARRARAARTRREPS